MWASIDVANVDDEDHLIITDRRSTQKQRHMLLVEGRVIARKVAEANSLTYINNLSIEDIYHHILAKRVIRRLKVNVKHKKLQRNLFQVLYRCTGLDIHACLYLAKQCY